MPLCMAACLTLPSYLPLHLSQTLSLSLLKLLYLFLSLPLFKLLYLLLSLPLFCTLSLPLSLSMSLPLP